MFSSNPFNEVDTKQKKGKTHRIDTTIKIECIEIDFNTFLIIAYIYPFQKILYL